MVELDPAKSIYTLPNIDLVLSDSRSQLVLILVLGATRFNLQITIDIFHNHEQELDNGVLISLKL